jgi:hypothetical protein
MWRQASTLSATFEVESQPICTHKGNKDMCMEKVEKRAENQVQRVPSGSQRSNQKEVCFPSWTVQLRDGEVEVNTVGDNAVNKKGVGECVIEIDTGVLMVPLTLMISSGF